MYRLCNSFVTSFLFMVKCHHSKFLYVRRMVLLLFMHVYTINYKIRPRQEEDLMGEKSMY